jgi:hypothetical protein
MKSNNSVIYCEIEINVQQQNICEFDAIHNNDKSNRKINVSISKNCMKVMSIIR